jgi:hypothetical protein
MRAIHAAAATVASAALLGPTADPASDRADMPQGRLVLGLHPPERVAVLDVASGALVERRLPGGTLCHGPLMVSGDEVFFLGSRRGRAALMSFDLTLKRRPRVVSPSNRQYIPSAREGAFWTLARSRAVREETADGRVLFRSRRRPPPGYPTGATAGGIVLEHRGSTRIWNPRSGAVRAAPGSWLIAASADRSAWCGRECRRIRFEGAGGPAATRPLRRGWSFSAAGGSLSPDGALLAVAAYGERRGRPPRIALARTRDGAVRLLPAPLAAERAELAWSPDGEWLYVATSDRRIAAYRPQDRRLVTLPVRLADEAIELSATD